MSEYVCSEEHYEARSIAIL